MPVFSSCRCVDSKTTWTAPQCIGERGGEQPHPDKTKHPPANGSLNLARKSLQSHMRQHHGETEYDDTRFIFRTTDLVERLFSTCRRAYTDYRTNMSLTYSKSQVCLYCNRDLWTLSDISNIVDWPSVMSLEMKLIWIDSNKFDIKVGTFWLWN